jgi:hypothetical protein
MPSIVSELHPLKNASGAEIIARLEDLAQQHQGLATQVRQVFGSSGNGRRPLFPPTNSDSKTVLIALLAILIDEISYSPTAPQRAGQISEVESACARLDIFYDDVLHGSRRAADLAKIFDGK